jgi:hypothetical protein
LVANKSATPKRKQAAIAPAAIVIAVVVVAGLAGLWYLDRASKRPPPAPAPLTGDARDYVRRGFLPMTEVDMQARESYLKQQIVEITGKIANMGDREIRLVELNCVFRDPYGQVVLRERVSIVSRKMGGLAPKEMKPFRLAFDNVPDDWNQAMPDLVIAQIEFS